MHTDEHEWNPNLWPLFVLIRVHSWFQSRFPIYVHPGSLSGGLMRRFALLAALPALWLIGCGHVKATGHSAGGAVLRYPVVVEPSDLDPDRLNDIYPSEMLQNVYEGLVTFDVDNKIAPAIAEKWDISRDGKTYTFHLRPNAKFHNGRVVTAADMKYTFERSLKDPKSPVALNYLGPIVGAQALHDGKARELAGVRAVDARTLEIKIGRPRGYFLGMLTYPTAWAVCREEIEKNGGRIDEHIQAGSGPYRLTEYRHGAKIVMEAFDGYWAGRPKLDRIERPIVIDYQTAHLQFENGEVDACEMALSDYVNDLKSPALKDQAHAYPYAAIQYVVMHPKLQPAFRDRRVRRAIAMAIDKDAIAVSAGRGVWERADSFIPPGIPGSNGGIRPISYDPAAARKLLAEAGYPDGKGFPHLTLVYVQKQPESEAAAEVIRENLRRNLGIEVDLQSREAAEFIANTGERETIAFWTAGWIADYPDPQDFLSTLLRTGAPLNHVAYSNPAFDSLCDRADALSDMSARIPLYRQADQIAMDDVAVLPLFARKQHYLVKPWVKDFQVNVMMPLPHKTTRIEK
jgi:oligopeptide transport system substrate-binding protein